MLHIILLIVTFSVPQIQAQVTTHALPIIANTCRKTCGQIPVQYPFGSGFGCGHPDFARYVKCESGTLQFSTRTGSYPVTSVDYAGNTLALTDPLMSTCDSMQNSGSFGLDLASPFRITTDDVFVLLGCSGTSPVFDSSSDFCAAGSASHVCRGIYSCKGVTGIGLEPNGPISTCCVYQPQVLQIGTGYDLDLPKLQCSSYTCINGFGTDEGDPNKWNYGVSLQFNSSYQNNICKSCETSGGICGFRGLEESFACVCRNGVNTTASCYGQGYAWSSSWRFTFHIKLSIQGFLLSWLVYFI